ncbi:MAG TPA: hypothetical protein VHE59_02835 [Mucilaginibacter sp.]|nr:hypothetical protein [Mucilaginibacter sp.]
MELILKTNNETSIAKILALARKLNIPVEQHDKNNSKEDMQKLKERILNFKAEGPSSFGDAAEWQQRERKDRDLPFSE